MTEKREEFLREFAETSRAYAEKTTRLSRLITRIETILNELPGRTEADSVNDHGDVLKFERERDWWHLRFYSDSNDGNRSWWDAVDAPVHVKAKVAVLLPDLIQRITKHQSVQLESVHLGLQAIENIPWIDADREVEIAKEQEIALRERNSASPSDDEVPF